MIVKTTRKPSPMSGYKKYFMFEAPGDEDEETPTPKANTKVIKINPDDKRRTDYTQYVPDPDANDGGEEVDQTDDTTDDATTDVPEDTPVDDTTDTGTEEPTATDEPDTTADENTPEDTPQDDTAAPETGDGGTDTGTEPMIDETDYGTGDDATQDAPENTDTADTPAETDVQTDDTDYNTDNETDVDTDAGDGDTETDTTDDTNQNDTTQQNTGLDDPDDKTHKFILFKKCISLESALSNYIQKLSGIMSDDLECNHIYKKITNNLKELDEMLHDYMTIKFENATYIQSMLFYQRLLASVGINLDMLKHIRQKEIKMNDKKSKH